MSTLNPLLYLVAHAPEQPWDCFEPDLTKLGAKPELPSRADPRWKFTKDQQLEVFAVLAKEAPVPTYAVEFGLAHAAAVEAREEWHRKAELERLVQWPWWWAKQMMDAAPAGINPWV